VILAALSKAITFVVGPTGSGKSHWALHEAAKNSGVILNADSIQFYKYLDIGSAKPTPEERERVPHFLFDVVAPDENFTAGDYRRAALGLIEEHSTYKPIYVVGGSGFYIQALTRGMYDIGPVPQSVREYIAHLGPREKMYEELLKKDPQAARRIGPHDSYRIQRALEINEVTGQTVQQVEEQFRKQNSTLSEKYDVRTVGLTLHREELRRRISARTERMLSLGWLDEVRDLMGRGYADTKALKSVGYKECLAHLRGELSRSNLFSSIVTSTMQLAKRQMTWFRRDQSVQWLASDARSLS